MFVAPVNEFGLVIDSQAGVRPATAYGTSFTPGNNTYSSYVSLLAGASVTDDAYGIWINVNSIGISATGTDTLVTIGADPAGGTSFSDLITDLVVSAAFGYATAAGPAGTWYFFPLLIKAGTSIGIKATQNNAAPAASRALVRLLCRPTRPELLRVGSFVRTFGSTPATSTGTGVTVGTTSDGAWTQLGSAVAAGDRLFFWQVGAGINSNSMSTEVLHADMGIGDATNKRTPILDVPVVASAAEQLGATYVGAYALAGPGDLIYGRMQGSAAAIAGFSMVAYGVG